MKEKQSDKENSLIKKNSMQSEPNFTKIINKKEPVEI